MDGPMRVQLSEGVVLRPIQASDDERVAELIRTVMGEFEATGAGYSVHDPEVVAMSGAYARPRSEYWVLEAGGRVVGGGGIAPLQRGAAPVCELRKMYSLPPFRGRGFGRRLLEHLLERARAHGFEQMYLESVARMKLAERLYRAAGFEELSSAMGNTGHYGCDRFLVRDIRLTTKVITVDDPLYEQGRQLRDEVLLRPLGLPDGAWEMHDTASRHIVLLDGKRVVAVALLRPAEKGRAQLLQMAVATERQRRGYGARLIHALMAEARRADISVVFCHARDGAIAFYERMGFRICGGPFVEVGVGHHPMEARVPAGSRTAGS